MNLHNKIINIQTDKLEGYYFGSEGEAAYKCGHRDARHAAAELALKAEARIEELENALRRAQEDINWMLNSRQFLNGFVFDYIDDALKK